MYFFSVESENDIVFLEKPIGKKLFNFKVIYSLCNTEEMLTFILLARRSSGHLFISGECRERAAGLDDMQVYDLL